MVAKHFYRMIVNRLRKAGAVKNERGILDLELWDRDDAHKVKTAIVTADVNPDGIFNQLKG